MKGKKRLFSGICNQPYGITTPYKLFDSAKNSKEFIQKLRLQRKILVHDGCVNSICWNDTGEYILSGSDDQKLAVVNGYDYSVAAHVETGHRANIFSAKFLPGTSDKHVVSCSGDGTIIFSNLDRPDTSLFNKFNCHRGTAYEIMTVPSDSHTFLSCGEDKSVRWFDLRTKTSCLKDDCRDDVLIKYQSPVTSLAVNPLVPYQLAVGCADAYVRIYDRRMLQSHATFSHSSACSGTQALMTTFTVPEFKQCRRITSLCYSPDGCEVLVSYSSDYIYLFNVKDDFEKLPKTLVKEGTSSNYVSTSGLFYRGQPLMKRLRVRGDWSDTGPNARTEEEARAEAATANEQGERAQQHERISRSAVIRAMSDILTRMVHTNVRRPSSGRRASDEEEDRGAPGPSRQAAETATESDSESRNENDNLARKKKKSSEADSSEPTNSSNTNDADLQQPSTSSEIASDETATFSAEQDKSDNSRTEQKNNADDKSSKKLKESYSSDLSTKNAPKYENIEQTLEARRKDLIEKHKKEPMVNLQYSGQSTSSGLITMDVANSSTANERQWLEQASSGATPVSPLLLPDDSSAPLQLSESEVFVTAESPCAPSTLHSGCEAESTIQTTHPSAKDTPPCSQTSDIQASSQQGRGSASSESETEANVQTIQPNDSLPGIQSMASEDSEENPEVELMMEVDSWDVDSDEEADRRIRRDSGGRRCDDSEDISSIIDEMEQKEAHMMTVNQPRVKKRYIGHRNARTMIKESTFWGNGFVMSGSDCGHIFVWDRHSAQVVMLMEADHHVVNCLQPHPFDPVLASSGIDYDIKLWAPLLDEPNFDEEKASEIIKRNEIMLEETKDTITVPASIMFRMLDSFRNFRSSRAQRWSRAAQELRRSGNLSRQDSV